MRDLTTQRCTVVDKPRITDVKNDNIGTDAIYKSRKDAESAIATPKKVGRIDLPSLPDSLFCGAPQADQQFSRRLWCARNVCNAGRARTVWVEIVANHRIEHIALIANSN